MRPLRCLLLVTFILSLVIFLITKDSASPKEPGPRIIEELTGNKKRVRGGLDYNTTYADDILRAMCDGYQQGLLAGDLCSSLCYYYDDWEIIDYKASNKHVIILNHAGQKFVLKTHHAMFDEYEQLSQDLLRPGAETDFIDLILSKVNDLLEIGWTKQHANHLIPVVWPSYSRTERLSKADKLSLFALVQQAEYVTFSVLPIARVFPKVTGSCGHLYAVEYLVPFRMKPQYSNLRAKILVHLMGTLKLFYEFLNEPLHWCDAKFENFGLSSDYPKRFMLMDADSIYTESKIQKILGDLKCRKDSDCNYMDCTATCDAQKGTCGQRTNDNVDVFCRKFVNSMFPNHVPYKNNRYISSCHSNATNIQRLQELRVVWAWSLSDV